MTTHRRMRRLDALLRGYAGRVNYRVLSPREFVPTALREGLHYCFRSGGKRLRPALTLLVCHATGGEPDTALDAAAAIELLHNSSLVLDDIIDGDDRRRGRLTFHRRFGIDVAIVTSGLLLSRAIQMVMAEPRQTALLAQAIRDLGMGQCLEVHARVNDLTGYERLIELKTAALFKAAAELGAVAARATRRRQALMARYGTHLGLAFQVRDDVLGASGSRKKLGKPVGSDMSQGRPSLVSILVCRRLGISLATLARRARKGYYQISGSCEFQGAVDEAQAIGVHHAEQARAALGGLKPTAEAQALSDLAYFAVERDH